MTYPDPVGPLWAGVGDAALPVDRVHAFLPHESVGGICLFLGTTRRWTGEAETEALDYDAYPPMAAQRLATLAETALARWDLYRVVALHRVGHVPVAEASVIVAAAAAHRAEAFEAARWLIDTLKTDVPIWKRETLAGGGSGWVESGTTPS